MSGPGVTGRNRHSGGRSIRAEVRCYADLKLFLPPARRTEAVHVCFEGPRSVKDLVESLGVPHTEIDLLLVDGAPAAFDRLIEADARVSAYPTFAVLPPPAAASLLRPRLPEKRFVADVHLGKLAKRLRLLGFDCLFDPAWQDPRLAQVSAAQQRILLTRDRRLLMRGRVTHGAFLRSDDPPAQTRYVVWRYGLAAEAHPFRRCASCNGLLKAVPKKAARQGVPPRTYRYIDTYFQCEDCRKFYWKGSHWDRLIAKVSEVLDQPAREPDGP